MNLRVYIYGLKRRGQCIHFWHFIKSVHIYGKYTSHGLDFTSKEVVAISQLPNSNTKWRGTTLAYRQWSWFPLIYIQWSNHSIFHSHQIWKWLPPSFNCSFFLGLFPFVSFSLCTIAPNQKFDSKVQSQFLTTILMISCANLHGLWYASKYREILFSLVHTFACFEWVFESHNIV